MTVAIAGALFSAIEIWPIVSYYNKHSRVNVQMSNYISASEATTTSIPTTTTVPTTKGKMPYYINSGA